MSHRGRKIVLRWKLIRKNGFIINKWLESIPQRSSICFEYERAYEFKKGGGGEDPLVEVRWKWPFKPAEDTPDNFFWFKNLFRNVLYTAMITFGNWIETLTDYVFVLIILFVINITLGICFGFKMLVFVILKANMK